jgi:hypothetical protein
MSADGRGERPIRGGACHSTTAPLHSIPRLCTIFPAHLPLGGALTKFVFLPICDAGARELLIANRDLNAVDANANGGEGVGGNTIAR